LRLPMMRVSKLLNMRWAGWASRRIHARTLETEKGAMRRLQ